MVKRIGRFILNVLNALCLLLCVAAVGLWVRSYWRDDGFHYLRDVVWDEGMTGWQFDAGSRYGGLFLGFQRRRVAFGDRMLDAVAAAGERRDLAAGVEVTAEREWFAKALARHEQGPWLYPMADLVPHGGVSPKAHGWDWRRGGFIVRRDSFADAKFWRSDWAVTIPHWSAVLLLGALPVARACRTLRRRRRIARGFCPSCGSNLRATPGRCPECGAVPGGESMIHAG